MQLPLHDSFYQMIYMDLKTRCVPSFKFYKVNNLYNIFIKEWTYVNHETKRQMG